MLWSSMALIPTETNRIIISENPSPCTLVIVPESTTITYRTHSNIISFAYNDNRVLNTYIQKNSDHDMVQAFWAKRQVEILQSSS
jgi:hypothetical protein